MVIFKNGSKQTDKLPTSESNLLVMLVPQDNHKKADMRASTESQFNFSSAARIHSGEVLPGKSLAFLVQVAERLDGCHRLEVG